MASRLRNKAPSLIAPVPLLLGVLLLCLLIQTIRAGALIAATLLAGGMLGLLLVGTTLVSTDGDRENLQKWAPYWAQGVCAALLLHLLIAVLHLSGYDVVYGRIIQIDAPLRAWGMFGHPNQLGVFAVLAATSALYLWHLKIISAGAGAALHIVASVLIIATLSRAAAVVAVAYGFWLLFDVRRLPRNRQLVLVFMAGCMFLAAALSLFHSTEVARWMSVWGPSQVGEINSTRGFSGSSRLEQYRFIPTLAPSSSDRCRLRKIPGGAII
ncbi:MAG: hypothetical protein QM742_14000 [Aquabacterium sp.]